MADEIKLSELDAVESLAGTELIPCVQSGSDKTVTPDQIATYVAANIEGGKADTVYGGQPVIDGGGA